MAEQKKRQMSYQITHVERPGVAIYRWKAGVLTDKDWSLLKRFFAAWRWTNKESEEPRRLLGLAEQRAGGDEHEDDGPCTSIVYDEDD